MPTPGPRAPPKPPTPEARAERRSRALEELLDVRPSAEGPPGVLALEVRNLKRHSHYLVLIPAYPDRTGAFCGCVDFARRDLGTCKHVEAAWLWRADHADALPPSPADPDGATVWSEIDRRSRRAVPTPLPASGRLRFLGEPLLSVG